MKEEIKLPFVLFASIVIGVLRPVFVFHKFGPHIVSSYMAVAHILVGFILGLLISTQKGMDEEHVELKVYFWSLVAVELICAAITLLR